MRTNQTSVAPRTFSATRLNRLLQALIEPAATIDDLALRRSSRLLAILLLTLIALFSLFFIPYSLIMPNFRAPWYWYLVFFGAYALNRTRYYHLAAGLTLAAPPLVIFIVSASDPTRGLSSSIQYLVLGIFLASIFVSRRGLALLAAANICSLLLLLIVLPTLSARLIVTPLAVNITAAALALIFLRHRDLIEQDRQAELRDNEERLQQALDAANMGTWTWDVLADHITWSAQVTRILGLAGGTGPKTRADYHDLVLPPDRMLVAEAVDAALASADNRYHVVHRLRWPNDMLRWLEVQGRVYRDAAGLPVRMAGTVIDITARKQAEAERAQAEAALAGTERRFHALIDACADAVVLFDRHGGVQYASPAATRMLGYGLGTYAGQNAFDLIHPDDRQSTTEQLAALVRQPMSRFTAEVRARHQDGTWRWFEATAVNSLEDPVIAGIVVNFHDITEHKQAEAALRASEERYRVISELLSDYAFAYQIGPDGAAVMEWITDAFTRITGYTFEELRMAEQSAALVHPDDRQIAEQRRRQLRAGQSVVNEYRVIAKDGRILWLRQYDRPLWDTSAGRVVRGYGAVQDVTQIKQLEHQLNQAQKMEAIGRLAAGIAHDFNNLLTVILGNADLLLDVQTDPQALRADAEQIRQAAMRAAALTRQLLAFSRQQVLEPRLLDLNAVVLDTSQLLRRLIGEDIELNTLLAPDLGWVQADPGQLEQVLMNLAVNARDAMPVGGTLTITTANATLDDTHIGVARGPAIMITISDTGVGMDSTTRTRIFEPFFTTKALGKGTGLGLATVHGIITQSGGSIGVDSEPGRGTTFKIYLPCADAIETIVSADAPVAQDLSGDATILLVEDESMLSDLASRVLRKYGYHILVAEDGPSALQIAAAHPGPIDLLLTDMIMPGGISGPQLAEQMRALRPATKVLFMSGYTDTVLPEAIDPSAQAFVQKPFTPASLARKVWECVRV